MWQRREWAWRQAECWQCLNMEVSYRAEHSGRWCLCWKSHRRFLYERFKKSGKSALWCYNCIHLILSTVELGDLEQGKMLLGRSCCTSVVKFVSWVADTALSDFMFAVSNKKNHVVGNVVGSRSFHSAKMPSQRLQNPQILCLITRSVSVFVAGIKINSVPFLSLNSR